MPTLPLSIMLLMLSSSTSMLAYFCMPLLLGFYADNNAVSEQFIGLLASSDLVGIAIASLLAPIWLKQANTFSYLISSMALVSIINFCSIFIDNHYLLLLFRVMGGFASAICYCLMLVIISRRQEAARELGFYNILNTAMIISFMLLLPEMTDGSYQTALMIICTTQIGVLSVLLANRQGLSLLRCQQSSSKPQRPLSLTVCVPLLAMLFFYINIGNMWSFSERIGSELAFSSSDIGNALAFANAIALLGGVIPTLLANRVGHRTPLIIGLLLQATFVTALWWLDSSQTLTTFALLLGLYFVFWIFVDIYFVTYIESIDDSNRAVSLVPAMQSIGSAIAPILMTALWFNSSYLEALSFSLLVITITLFTVIMSRLSQREGTTLVEPR